MASTGGTTKRTRLSPEGRRDQIVDTALQLFGERGYAGTSVTDIAQAAGVTAALVHHYFGTKREIYLAVLQRAGDAINTRERADPSLPLEERASRNLAAWMDWVGTNRALWLATAGLGDVVPDAEILAILVAAREESAAVALADYGDAVEDTPTARAALVCWMGLNQTALRRWLRGDATREETHAILTQTLVAMFRDVIPRLNA